MSRLDVPASRFPESEFPASEFPATELPSDFDKLVDAEPIEKPRLAAMVFTDVVGYSARMGRDEAGTIAAVDADFKIMRDACSQYDGEVLNTMGDGMMICFGSSVNAMKFALHVQDEFGRRNVAMLPARGLEHRIGIHVGDVYKVKGGHVAGDGVNIAARLESRAPKGGICISQAVYDTVKSKVKMRAEPMGPQTLKNIAEPMPAWRVTPDSAVKVAAAPVRVRDAPKASNGWLYKIVWIVVALIAIETLWPYRDRIIPKTWDLSAVTASVSKAGAFVKSLLGMAP